MKKLISCKACGKEVAKGSKSCPSCGKDNRSFFAKHKIISGILIIAIISILSSAMGGDSENTVGSSETTNNSGITNNTESKKEDSKVNYDNFLKISMGSTYEEVTAILGEGVEDSSSEIAGIKTTMYSWDGKGLSSLNVTIQDGVVTGKAQIGLKDMDANVTLENFNSVSEGMTYEEVVAILGEGEIISESEIMDYTSVMYQWMNKDGSNMNAMFQGNSLTMKSQFNLK